VKYLLMAVALAASLVGCKSAPEREREEEAVRIVTRTITEPQTTYIEVDKLVSLPPELTVDCKVAYREGDRVRDYMKSSDLGVAYAEECNKRMQRIREMQP
jgi:hypothetical protein